jgi:short-subunit dehydrogenase
MTDLTGAHVVITGGSSGIGLETARLAVERGARVSLIARDAARLARAAADVGAAAFTSGAVFALWPLWAAGLVFVGGAILVLRP